MNAAIITVYRGPHQPDTDIDDKTIELEQCLQRLVDKHHQARETTEGPNAGKVVGKTLALASSLAIEDNVLLDAIARLRLPISVFTLDTGRLNPETLAMRDTLVQHYGVDIKVYRPAAAAVDAWVASHGLDSIYDSLENRRGCCTVRKVEPLQQALHEASAWLTGQRRGQGSSRSDLALEEWDSKHNMSKYNLLADWSEADIWTYARRFKVPVNPLHLAGYPSIGCAPCTRAITLGEDIRAGRWWWEDEQFKECGLHPNTKH